MITHEEAREENNLMMNNHIQLTKEKYPFAPKVWERRKQHYLKIDDYITQQEKKDKLIEMYQTFLDNYVKQQIWTCPLLEKIKELEEELK